MFLFPLKIFDRYLGRFFVCFFRKKKYMCEEKIRSILIIRPGGIGDAVLLIPVISAIKLVYPDSTIDILAEKRNAAVFTLSSDVRAVYLYDNLSGLSVLRNRYNVVIDAEQWYRLSAVVARLVEAPLKIGFATNERARLFTYPVPYSLDDYEVYNFLALLCPLRITAPAAPQPPFLQIPKNATVTVTSLLVEAGLKDFVALFPGASVPEKRWPTERFVSLASRLIPQRKVVVVGGKEDVSIGEEIASVGGVNLAGKTSLAETAAVISQADVLVSGDSGVLHLAFGLDVPTVALFGPSSVAKWAPRGVCDKVLTASLACSPCSRYGTIPQCPNGVRCMHDISVDQVVLAVDSVIAESAAMKKNVRNR